MPDPLLQSILCPVLIGRDAQVAALTRLLEQARTGHGQITLISGEAGIGKSRLVAEVKQLALDQGFILRQGNCFEPDRVLPYAPLIDLLRMLPKEITPPPDLLALLSGQHLFAEDAPEQAKRRLFATLTDFLSDPSPPLATRHSQFVIIEDIHWCDETSLEFLLFFVRQIASRPLLLLLTYRPDEVQPGLQRFLAALDRTRLTTELALPPLTEKQVDQMIRTLFGQQQPIRHDFLYTVSLLSEGNPFFIEEMLKSLVAAGDIYPVQQGWERKPLQQLHIPRSVQAAVQNRLADLSTAARQLVQVAAVAGRRFDFAVLQRVTGAAEPTLVALIKEMIAAQLVVEESADSFAFRHALTRQAIYSELLVRERQPLHRAVGEALAQLDSAHSVAQSANLAYHFYEGGQWEPALHFARQAGEQAQMLYAPRAAIEHFTRALAAARQLQRNHEEAPLYAARGQAREQMGDFDGALADYEQALQLARRHQDHHAEWQNLLALGFLWTARDYGRADGYFQQALQLARTSGEATAIARSLNRVGNWYVNAEAAQTALAYHHEALALLQAAGDQPGIAETLDLLGTATYYCGDLSQAAHYYQQTIALCRTLDKRMVLVSGLLLFAAVSSPNYLHNTLVWPPPNHGAAEAAGHEALALCQAMEWHARQPFVHAYLAWRAGAQGAYRTAFGQAQAALTGATDSAFHLTAAHLALALLYLDLYALDAAQTHIAQARNSAEQVGAPMIRHFVVAVQAQVWIAQRRFAEAQELLRTTCPPTTPKQSPAQRMMWTAWIQLLLATRQPADGLALATALVDESAKREGNCIPLLWQLRAEALLALKQPAAAAILLAEAAQAAQTHAALPLLWRIQSTQAHCAVAQGESREAERFSSQARTLIDDLAIEIDDPAIASHFTEHAQTLFPTLRPATANQRAKRAYDGLTTREREVALLVAQGKTNLEIAHTLTLTERTVESHVSNILAKLAFTNRSQIAAWAVAKGLTR